MTAQRPDLTFNKLNVTPTVSEAPTDFQEYAKWRMTQEISLLKSRIADLKRQISAMPSKAAAARRDRATKAWLMRQEGKKLAEIGTAMGVSAGRARQLVKAHERRSNSFDLDGSR